MEGWYRKCTILYTNIYKIIIKAPSKTVYRKLYKRKTVQPVFHDIHEIWKIRNEIIFTFIMSQSGEDTSLLMMLIISYLSLPKKTKTKRKEKCRILPLYWDRMWGILSHWVRWPHTCHEYEWLAKSPPDARGITLDAWVGGVAFLAHQRTVSLHFPLHLSLHHCHYHWHWSYQKEVL